MGGQECENKGTAISIKKLPKWDFPDGPVVKTLPSNTESMGSNPGQGTKIPYAWKPRNQNVKQRQH